MSTAPLEIERKYRCDDLTTVRSQLQSAGARWLGTEQQVDRYLAHPARDFRASDEALRIRTTHGRAQLTYKGPRRERVTKIREELEVELGAAETATLATVLERLGFRTVREVNKTRSTYGMPFADLEALVCLDEVRDLGSFVEIEVVADAFRMPQAKAAVEAIASQLQLREPIEESYLALLRARDEAMDSEPE
jgi:adenylate cyclase class 2